MHKLHLRYTYSCVACIASRMLVHQLLMSPLYLQLLSTHKQPL